jgi:ATP-binding cassette subfamily A (ABC1) protein 3
LLENGSGLWEKCFRKKHDQKIAEQEYNIPADDPKASPILNSKLSNANIQMVENTNELAIKVAHLKKMYPLTKTAMCSCGENKKIAYKTAVKDVTFGVEKGTCFGLLGTNGAGKTTTFKVLTGDEISTLGKVMINGKNVATEMNQVRHLIGYCPQFDSLLDLLSSREHLELYAAIKGIPQEAREPLINQLLVQMNLSKFEHVNAGTYSGGNKRKLSVAIALIGNPPIILLDEPSSGMDPEARRFMWAVISRLTNEKKQSTVVLTTHSMEEAEALSTKLAIMVEGNLRCIGPVQSIKDKYGKGFEVEVKLNLPSDDELRKRANYDQNNKMDGLLEEGQIREFFDY